MDQQYLSLRLSRLAGGAEGVDLPEIVRADYVLGRLGFIRVLRFAQAAMFTGVWCSLLYIGLVCINIHPGNWLWALGAVHAGVGMVLARRLHYWAPTTPLRQGLIALSRLKLNDPRAFIANQRTDLSRINYALLTDLCMQLAMDTRRSQARGD